MHEIKENFVHTKLMLMVFVNLFLFFIVMNTIYAVPRMPSETEIVFFLFILALPITIALGIISYFIFYWKDRKIQKIPKSKFLLFLFIFVCLLFIGSMVFGLSEEKSKLWRFPPLKLINHFFSYLNYLDYYYHSYYVLLLWILILSLFYLIGRVSKFTADGVFISLFNIIKTDKDINDKKIVVSECLFLVIIGLLPIVTLLFSEYFLAIISIFIAPFGVLLDKLFYTKKNFRNVRRFLSFRLLLFLVIYFFLLLFIYDINWYGILDLIDDEISSINHNGFIKFFDLIFLLFYLAFIFFIGLIIKFIYDKICIYAYKIYIYTFKSKLKTR